MIEASLIKFLSAQEQTDMRMFEKLFESDGWKELSRHIAQGHEDSITRLINADNWADNRFQKGAATAYLDILNAPERVSGKYTANAIQNKETIAQEAMDAEEDYE